MRPSIGRSRKLHARPGRAEIDRLVGIRACVGAGQPACGEGREADLKRLVGRRRKSELLPRQAPVLGPIEVSRRIRDRALRTDQHPAVPRVDKRPRRHGALHSGRRERRPGLPAVSGSRHLGAGANKGEHADGDVEEPHVTPMVPARAGQLARPAHPAVIRMQDRVVAGIEVDHHPAGGRVDEVHRGDAIWSLRRRAWIECAAEERKRRMEVDGAGGRDGDDRCRDHCDRAPRPGRQRGQFENRLGLRRLHGPPPA